MKDRWSVAWVMAFALPILLFLAACDDNGGGGTQVVVITNDVGQVVTNTITPPEPETLQDRTYTVAAGGGATTDAVTAPDDGIMSATVDWSGGQTIGATFIRNGVALGVSVGVSPLMLSAPTDDGQNWQVALSNSNTNSINARVVIRYAPD